MFKMVSYCQTVFGVNKIKQDSHWKIFLAKKRFFILPFFDGWSCEYKHQKIQPFENMRLNEVVKMFYCLSVFLSFCLSVFLSFRLSVSLPFFLSFCLSFCLSAFLSFCLSVSLSFFLSFCLSVITKRFSYLRMYNQKKFLRRFSPSLKELKKRKKCVNEYSSFCTSVSLSFCLFCISVFLSFYLSFNLKSFLHCKRINKVKKVSIDFSSFQAD